jgi:hypothetical protein
MYELWGYSGSFQRYYGEFMGYREIIKFADEDLSVACECTEFHSMNLSNEVHMLRYSVKPRTGLSTSHLRRLPSQI